MLAVTQQMQLCRCELPLAGKGKGAVWGTVCKSGQIISTLLHELRLAALFLKRKNGTARFGKVGCSH